MHGTSFKAWTELVNGTRCLMRGGPMRVRRADHFAVSLPGDTGRNASGFRAGSRVYICFDLRLWLRQGRPACRSTNNVLCMYEDVPRSFFLYVIDKWFSRELYNDSTNHSLVKNVHEGRLGVEADGSFTRNPAHARITFTPAGYVQLICIA